MTRRRRIVAGIAGLALLLGVGLTPPVQQSDAYFTDAEYGSATFTSILLATPTITSCTVQNNVLGVFQSATLVWTAPYPLTGVKLTATSGANTGTVSSGISVSGPVGGVYTYTAVLTEGLLTSIISNLLGSTTTLAVTSVYPGSSWTSPAVTRKLTIALLGLGATCTV